jgi:23S rRNA pseudouridine2605 synthase
MNFMERLQKIMAHGGICSRRRAEELIQDGAVKINGAIIRELGSKADPAVDRIEVRGYGFIEPEAKTHLLMYKPIRVVTTVDDPEGRTTVMDILNKVAGRGKGPAELPRLYPIGRLDFDSEGAVLLTNDGELANRLMHPRYGVKKTYHVKVKGVPSETSLNLLRRGVRLPDMRGGLEPPTAPAKIDLLQKTTANAWIAIVIREGRHHQIRRMCEKIGHPVIRLIRTAYGPIELGDLQPSQWRFLTADEVELLDNCTRSEHKTAPAGRKTQTRTKATKPKMDLLPQKRREQFSRSLRKKTVRKK